MEWRLGDSLGIIDRGTQAKIITSCDNAFVTNILSLTLRLHYAFAQKNICCPETLERKRSGSSDAPRKLCSVRKRSVSDKAPSRNGNKPHVMVINLIYRIIVFII
ncbi:hypothetical protein [Lysinibacillus sp. TE18511]